MQRAHDDAMLRDGANKKHMQATPQTVTNLNPDLTLTLTFTPPLPLSYPYPLPVPLMQAIVQSVKEVGAKDTAMLHAAAQKLSIPLGCEWTQLWLVEHVAGGAATGHRQQVVTQHRDEAVTLPPDMPASGRGLIGLVLTTGTTTVIQPYPLATLTLTLPLTPTLTRTVTRTRTQARPPWSLMRTSHRTITRTSTRRRPRCPTTRPQCAPCLCGTSAPTTHITPCYLVITPTRCVVPLRDHCGQVMGVLQAGGKRQTEKVLQTGAEALKGWLPPSELSPAFTSEDLDFLEVMGISYLLLTTYYLLLTAYYSLLTAHYLLLTTCYSLLTTHY